MPFLLRTLIPILISWWFRRRKLEALNLVKAEGVKTYLKVLQGARYSVMGLVALLIVLQLVAFGFALMLGAVVFLVPLDFETKLWALFGLGALLFTLPTLAFLVIFRERLWYEVSGAQGMVEKALEKEIASS